MSEAPVSPPKTPPPGLSVRAPRPRPLRVRPAAAAAIALGAAGLIGGALAWSLVISPNLRDRPPADHMEATKPAEGASRPSDLITRQPATYAQPPPDLPPPRGFGEPAPAQDVQPKAPSPPKPAAAAGGGSSLSERALESGLLFSVSLPGPRPDIGLPAPPPAQPTGATTASMSATLQSPSSPFQVQAGSILPATLLTAIDTARPGPVVAITTQGVYDSVRGAVLLVPQGTRLIGRQDGAANYGDRRAFLVWERLILPNGKSLRLAAEPAVDPEGRLGLRGDLDRRLGPLARASILAGAVTTLGQAARDRDDDAGGLIGDAGDAAAIQAAQIGGRMIGRELDLAPSIRLPAGAAVRVLLTHDLALEPWTP